jgi:hypothetical protein
MANLVLSCVYGSKHIPFVHTFIFSVLESCPDVRVIIGHSDFPEFERNLLEIAYPQVTFVNIALINRVTSTHAARASKKTYLWWQLLENSVSYGDNAVFLDIDTIIVKSPFEVFESEGDLALTRKLGKWSLNTGVIFVKKSSSTLDFFREWNTSTENIIRSKNLNSIAEAQNGGADQHSLIKLLKVSNSITDFSIGSTYSKEFRIQIRFLPCSRYNETESVPLNNELMIIHFKAGWHKILLSRSKYSRNRPAKTSTEFHDIWKSCYSKSKYEIFKAIIEKSSFEYLLTRTIVKNESEEGDNIYSQFFTDPWLFKILEVRNIIEFHLSDKNNSLKSGSLLKTSNNSKMASDEIPAKISPEFSDSWLQNVTNFDFRHRDGKKMFRTISSTKTSRESNYGVIIRNFDSFHSLYLAARLVRIEDPPSIIFVNGMRDFGTSEEQASFTRFLYKTHFDRVYFSDEHLPIRQKNSSNQSFLFGDPISQISMAEGSDARNSCFILPTLRDSNILHRIFLWPIKPALNLYWQFIRSYFRLWF